MLAVFFVFCLELLASRVASRRRSFVPTRASRGESGKLSSWSSDLHRLCFGGPFASQARARCRHEQLFIEDLLLLSQASFRTCIAQRHEVRFSPRLCPWDTTHLSLAPLSLARRSLTLSSCPTGDTGCLPPLAARCFCPHVVERTAKSGHEHHTGSHRNKDTPIKSALAPEGRVPV